MKEMHLFRNRDFIAYPMRYIPLQSSLLIIYTISNSLMPAYETIALANFIDCAMDIFEGKRNHNEIIVPIVMIVLYILFINLIPTVAEIISLTGKNKMTMRIKELILNKRMALEYQYVENPETQELINRVCSDPVGNFLSGFNNILSAVSIIISSISLLAIIMTTTFISGIVIVAVSIPLFAIAIKTGAG